MGKAGRPDCECKEKYKGHKPNVCPHYNHLVICPDSAKEWDYEKNYPSRPENISPTATKCFYWICSVCNISTLQKTASRKNGSRCKYCYGNSVSKSNSLAILRPDIAKFWDFEKNYPLTPEEVRPRSNKKVWWLCTNHPGLKDGVFSYEKHISEQTRRDPSKSKETEMCPFCNSSVYRGKIGGHDAFVKSSNFIHKNKYVYNDFYITSKQKIKIYCTEIDDFFGTHGIFMQSPNNHLKGAACPKCDKSERAKVGGHNLFVFDCRKIHGDKYEYISEYTESTALVKIFCKKYNLQGKQHGIFLQTAAVHKAGSGCPKCSNEQSDSKQVKKFDDITNKYNLKVENEWNDRKNFVILLLIM